MDPALYIAMSGAMRSMAEQGVYGNNLANVSTPGFRQDLYRSESAYMQHEGLNSQAYALTEKSAIDFKAGPIMSTSRDLDMAIRGEGWFVIQSPDGQTAYTRKGDFSVNSAGLLTTGAGHLVLGEGGPISIPPYESIQVGVDGSITVVPRGEDPTAATVLDRVLLVNPEQGELAKGADGLIYSKNGGTAEADSSVKVATRSLEGSNVNSVDQMVHMITASKEFETQLKLMKTIDDNQESLAQLLRIR